MRRRHRTFGCGGWLPLFRDYGELRKPLTKQYRQWLRWVTVRRLLARGRTNQQRAIALATAAAPKQEHAIVMAGLAMCEEFQRAAGRAA